MKQTTNRFIITAHKFGGFQVTELKIDGDFVKHILHRPGPKHAPTSPVWNTTEQAQEYISTFTKVIKT